MSDPVECYSGSSYGERPAAFQWQGRRLEVTAVLERWRIPAGRRFLVSTPGGQVFELAYDEGTGDWSIEPFPLAGK